jgi:hypothetical protein
MVDSVWASSLPRCFQLSIHFHSERDGRWRSRSSSRHRLPPPSAAQALSGLRKRRQYLLLRLAAVLGAVGGCAAWWRWRTPSRRLGRAEPFPGGYREQLRRQDAGRHGHAPPHPHSHALRALDRAPGRWSRTRHRSPSTTRGGSSTRSSGGGCSSTRTKRNPAVAVHLEGAGRGLRPGARGQNQRRARQRRPPAGRARLRGAQPGEGGALHALRQRPHRQLVHHRSQDRSSQDARPYPEEAILGLNLKSFFCPLTASYLAFRFQ